MASRILHAKFKFRAWWFEIQKCLHSQRKIDSDPLRIDYWSDYQGIQRCQVLFVFRLHFKNEFQNQTLNLALNAQSNHLRNQKSIQVQKSQQFVAVPKKFIISHDLHFKRAYLFCLD